MGLLRGHNKPFAEVVRIREERTRQEIEDPIKAVRQNQKVMGFSNSLVLTSRDGKEYPH